jgi:hypothetical protein
VAYFEITNAQPSLAFSKTDYTADLGPASVAVGDLNGDGKLDLVVANFYGNDLSVMLGNGDGTFQPTVNHPAPGSPRGVALGDFNGDGVLDIVAALFNANQVSVLLGNGNGTFQAPVNYSTIGRGGQVSVGDFNGDGKLDLAVTNITSPDVAVLLGNGDGTFQGAVIYPTGATPATLAAADFNGDGKLDLAVGNNDGSNVSVLLGNGDGTFQLPVNYSVGSLPDISPVVGDFNGEGKLDLAVANDGNNNVSVLLGNGDGTFQAAVNYPAGSDPIWVSVGDLNGDGKLDLAVADRNFNNVSVLIGNGDGTFQAAVNYALVGGAQPYAVAFGDFNGDGRMDMVTANNGAASVSVFLQPPPAVGTGNTGVLFITAGAGITSTGGQTPTLSLNTGFTDGRYAQLATNNTFAGSQTMPSLTVTGAMTSGSVNSAIGNFSGNFNGTLLNAQNGSTAGNSNGISGSGVIGVTGIGSNWGVSGYSGSNVGVEGNGRNVGVYGFSSSGVSGVFGSSTTAVGVYGNSAGTAGATTVAAGVFNNTAGGNILLGQNNSVNKFSVDGSGNVVAGGAVTIGSGTPITQHISQLFTGVTFNSKLTPSTCTVWSGTISSAADGDTVAAGLASSLMSANIVYSAWAGDGSVSVRICNPTGAPITISAGNIRIDVWKH